MAGGQQTAAAAAADGVVDVVVVVVAAAVNRVELACKMRWKIVRLEKGQLATVYTQKLTGKCAKIASTANTRTVNKEAAFSSLRERRLDGIRKGREGNRGERGGSQL